jgi:hypothetical protein
MGNLPQSEWSKERSELHDCFHNSIPLHLAYACTYWASHLVAGLNTQFGWNVEVNKLLEDFAIRHLLNWLEALSIIGRVDTAFSSLETIHTTIVCNLLVIPLKFTAWKFS